MSTKAGDETMTASSTPNPDTLTVNVSQFIRAPRQRVFQAWVDADLRRKWWRTHSGDGLADCQVDARVGGRYRMSQIGSGCESPDDDPNYEWVMQGEFLEVVPPEKLVFTWNVNHQPPVVDDRVTVEFHEVEGGTQVSITHQGIQTIEMRDGTKGGWTTHLQALAEVMEQE